MNQFKRVQVIMLPTLKESILLLNPTTNKFGLTKETSRKIYPIEEYIKLGFIPQHLYIISDDEIKENDYCLNLETNTVFKMHNHGLPTSNRNKKIIATTDTSLYQATGKAYKMVDGFKPTYKNLPQPSQQFIEIYIEFYNKGNIITDVLVECKRVFETIAKGMIGHPEDDISWWNEKLKINPKDNTITIKKLKDSWNREEHAADVKRLCNLLYFSANIDVDFNTKEELDNWIDQNL